MLEMLRDLIAHKAHANATLLNAIDANPAAAADPELRELLQHVLLANRFWLLTILDLPFVLDEESRPAATFKVLIEGYVQTHAQEAAWMAGVTRAELDRRLENPFIPGLQCSIAQAVMQVCLHSLGHRAQAAKLLRRHGSTPPMGDFILWLIDRPPAVWPEPASRDPAGG